MPATPNNRHNIAGSRSPQTPLLIRNRSATPEVKDSNARELTNTPERGQDRTDVNGVLIIDSSGDIILDTEDESAHEEHSFRVNTVQLSASSAYFKTLLSSRTFTEGVEIADKHKDLLHRFTSFAEVPVTELPHLKIADVGRLGPVKSIKPLLTDFFHILHGYRFGGKKPPLSNIANLAIVADRFDAGPTVGGWVKKKWILGQASSESYTEETARQRLLAGLIFGHEPWVSVSSYQLVRYGSTKWMGERKAYKGLWWDLPRGLEEELDFRRQCILETLASVQAHILEIFSSKTQQCKLGYDTSPQCDAFQLGEFVRFLVRGGMVDMQRAVGFEGDAEPFRGDIKDLMTKLRSCPSYQLDVNHSHCGPKKPLLQALEAVDEQFQTHFVGICSACWDTPGSVDRWLDAKRPVSCNGGIASYNRNCAVNALHEYARDFFLAEKKDWSAIIAAQARRSGARPLGTPPVTSTRSDSDSRLRVMSGR